MAIGVKKTPKERFLLVLIVLVFLALLISIECANSV